MAAKCFLGKDLVAIDGDFKQTARTGDQVPITNMNLDFAFVQDFVRQTDGARGVASSRAVFKCDVGNAVLHVKFSSVMYCRS